MPIVYLMKLKNNNLIITKKKENNYYRIHKIAS